VAAEQIALASNAPELVVVVLRPRFVWGRDDTAALPALTEAAGSGKLAWMCNLYSVTTRQQRKS
jgi:hypothetical protein